ncbi:MAG: Glycosyltransferase, partial [uncultured Pseudonocardia sp.]
EAGDRLPLRPHRPPRRHQPLHRGPGGRARRAAPAHDADQRRAAAAAAARPPAAPGGLADGAGRAVRGAAGQRARPGRRVQPDADDGLVGAPLQARPHRARPHLLPPRHAAAGPARSRPRPVAGLPPGLVAAAAAAGPGRRRRHRLAHHGGGDRRAPADAAAGHGGAQRRRPAARRAGDPGAAAGLHGLVHALQERRHPRAGHRAAARPRAAPDEPRARRRAGPPDRAGAVRTAGVPRRCLRRGVRRGPARRHRARHRLPRRGFRHPAGGGDERGHAGGRQRHPGVPRGRRGRRRVRGPRRPGGLRGRGPGAGRPGGARGARGGLPRPGGHLHLGGVRRHPPRPAH